MEFWTFKIYMKYIRPFKILKMAASIFKIMKVKKKAKDRNRYNQGPHLTRDTIWGSDKTHGNISHKRAKRTGVTTKAFNNNDAHF